MCAACQPPLAIWGPLENVSVIVSGEELLLTQHLPQLQPALQDRGWQC